MWTCLKVWNGGVEANEYSSSSIKLDKDDQSTFVDTTKYQGMIESLLT